MRSADIPLLVAAFCLYSATYYIRAQRWRLLLNAQDIDVSIPVLIKSYMVSVFFSNFLPSTIAGDVVRAYDSWRMGISKMGAVAVIFMDRFLGILALVIFAFGALLFSNKMMGDLQFLQLWILTAVIVAFFGVWITFIPPRQILTFVRNTTLILPRKCRSIVDATYNAFQAFQGRKDTLASTLGLSLVFQTGVVIHYYLIARALNFSVPFHSFFLIVPLAIFIMMLPIAINAIGLRENTFMFFFSTFGVSKPDAIAFAWLGYGVVVLLGLLGGLVYAFRK